jgi:predicted GNAT family acetyltransferase
MEVRFHESSEEFRAVAEPFYGRDPVGHTIELTVLRGALPDDSVLLTVWENSEIVGAALQTPPYPLACNGIPARSIDVVAAEVARMHHELTGVRGSNQSAVAYADAWRTITGRVGSVTAEERLYRLGRLAPPSGVDGVSRAATDDDRAVLVDWVEQFFVETFSHSRDTQAGEGFVRTAKDKGDRFLLWIVDGRPVSMAMLRAPAAGVSRIGPVFTPVDCRGHGYGSAITAAAAGLALRTGVDDVVLFADLANPTSNGIYQRIGFEPVVDSVRLEFVAVD